MFKKMKFTNTNHKTKMEKQKTMLVMMMKTRTTSSDMKKLEIFDISTEVSWIWDILDTEREYSCKNQTLDLTGNSRLDELNQHHFISNHYLIKHLSCIQISDQLQSIICSLRKMEHFLELQKKKKMTLHDFIEEVNREQTISMVTFIVLFFPSFASSSLFSLFFSSFLA